METLQNFAKTADYCTTLQNTRLKNDLGTAALRERCLDFLGLVLVRSEDGGQLDITVCVFHFRVGRTALFPGDRLGFGDIDRSAAVGDGEAECLADINL